jgi:DNA repair ATPase RecN
LAEESEGLRAELISLRKDKLQVFSDMRSKESLDNITKKLKRLGELKVELGKLKGLMEQQSKAKSDLTEAEIQLKEILESISQEIENVYLFEKKFNIHLNSLTKKFHNEEYSIKLNFNKDSGACSIELINSATNPEGGKKKAEVIAFDFAYIYAVEELKLKRPKFIFHDSIEDIDKKQIEDIFKEANKLPGQQILSMLSDKISAETYNQISKNVILSLYEDEKFFCV